MIKQLILVLSTALIISGCSPSTTNCDTKSFKKFDSTTCTDTTGGGTTGGGGVVGSTGNISYVPLMVFEKHKDFSGFSKDDLFRLDGTSPYINHYLINPVDDQSLASVATATVQDFVTTVNEIEIDPYESHPMLQKVVGMPITLQTALVFDVSGSTDNADIAALVAEAKIYIADAQSNSDSTIANQLFTVWAFGTDIQELTAGFTNNTGAINAALDTVEALSISGLLLRTTNLHKAIVQAIGRHIPSGFNADGTNDLIDIANSTGINLSQLVLFSSGTPSYLEVDVELMTNAIESQSFVKFDQATATPGQTTIHLYKPVFYYVIGSDVGPGTPYGTLADLAEVTTALPWISGTYTFATDLITKQIAAIDVRVKRTDQYLYRYAFLPRIGDFDIAFTTKSTGYNYTITSEERALAAGLIGTPENVLASLVEITGPAGEYLPNNQVSLSNLSTFYPKTRWTNLTYGASDYTWALIGGVGVSNADGSYTVNTLSVSPAQLTVTNNARGLGETASILVFN